MLETILRERREVVRQLGSIDSLSTTEVRRLIGELATLTATIEDARAAEAEEARDRNADSIEAARLRAERLAHPPDEEAADVLALRSFTYGGRIVRRGERLTVNAHRLAAMQGSRLVVAADHPTARSVTQEAS